MSAKICLTTLAIAQFSKDHMNLMQQMASTNEMVAWLVAGQPLGTQGAQGPEAIGHDPPEQRPLHQRTNLPLNRTHDEFQVHHASLPKLQFPRFSGDNPCI
jgi:hypothetical protein